MKHFFLDLCPPEARGDTCNYRRTTVCLERRCLSDGRNKPVERLETTTYVESELRLDEASLQCDSASNGPPLSKRRHRSGTATVLAVPSPTNDHEDLLDGVVQARLSFEEFYRAEYRGVVGLAFVLTGDSGVAQDLTQVAFTEAHRRWSKISHYERPGAWVRRVLVNKSTSRYRRLASEAKALTRLGGRPQVEIEPTERTLEVWEAVRRLPARQAQSIALRYWDDLPVSAIAEVLDCSQETVKTHLKRGRATLATQLSDFRGFG